MSVPVNERSHGKLEACVKARELCVYTLRITVNPKIFKPEYQHALTDKIVDTALEIAKPIYHLATKRVIFWSGLAIETRKLIRAWREADRKRYSAKFK